MPTSYRLPARYGVPAPVQPVGGRSRSQSALTQRRSGGSNAGRHPCRGRARSVSFGGRPETGPARHGIDDTVVVRAPEDIGPHISAAPTGGEGWYPLTGFRTCEAVMASSMRVPCVFPRRSIRSGRCRSAPGDTGDDGGCAPRSAIRTVNLWEEARTVPGREKKLTRERRRRMVDSETDVCRPGARCIWVWSHHAGWEDCARRCRAEPLHAKRADDSQGG